MMSSTVMGMFMERARFSSREYASLSEQEPLVPAPGVEAVSLTLPRKLEPEAADRKERQFQLKDTDEFDKGKNNHLYACHDWRVFATSHWLPIPEHKCDYDGRGPFLAHLRDRKQKQKRKNKWVAV